MSVLLAHRGNTWHPEDASGLEVLATPAPRRCSTPPHTLPTMKSPRQKPKASVDVPHIIGRSNTSSNFVESICQDVLDHILQFLGGGNRGPKDLRAFQLVCSDWQSIFINHAPTTNTMRTIFFHKCAVVSSCRSVSQRRVRQRALVAECLGLVESIDIEIQNTSFAMKDKVEKLEKKQKKLLKPFRCQYKTIKKNLQSLPTSEIDYVRGLKRPNEAVLTLFKVVRLFLDEHRAAEVGKQLTEAERKSTVSVALGSPSWFSLKTFISNKDWKDQLVLLPRGSLSTETIRASRSILTTVGVTKALFSSTFACCAPMLEWVELHINLHEFFDDQIVAKKLDSVLAPVQQLRHSRAILQCELKQLGYHV